MNDSNDQRQRVVRGREGMGDRVTTLTATVDQMQEELTEQAELQGLLTVTVTMVGLAVLVGGILDALRRGKVPK